MESTQKRDVHSNPMLEDEQKEATTPQIVIDIDQMQAQYIRDCYAARTGQSVDRIPDFPVNGNASHKLASTKCNKYGTWW